MSTPAPSGPVVEAQGLRMTWPGAATPALALDAWSLHAGEAVFVRGPSGSGKSTLLGLLAGVLEATEGRVCFQGQDWGALTPAQRDRRRGEGVGYVFQQFNLLPYLSVLQNVLLPCRLAPRRAAREDPGAGGPEGAARALLKAMQLPESCWARRPEALSVGQQQRAAAARALIGRPALVLADEPTSALDDALRDGFVEELLQACATQRTALVFVSHDARLAPHFARTLEIESGVARERPA